MIVKQFLTEMLSGGNDVSSKRVNGTIGFLSVIVITIISIVFNLNIGDTQHALLTLIVSLSAGLIAGGMLEKQGKNITSKG